MDSVSFLNILLWLDEFLNWTCALGKMQDKLSKMTLKIQADGCKKITGTFNYKELLKTDNNPKLLTLVQEHTFHRNCI